MVAVAERLLKENLVKNRNTSFWLASTLIVLCGCSQNPDKQTPRNEQRIRISAAVIPGCPASHPIAVSVTNISAGQIDEIAFSVYANQIGHSRAIATSGRRENDKILAPGAGYTVCVGLDQPYGTNFPLSEMEYSATIDDVWPM